MIESIITIVVAIFASTGFWSWLSNRSQGKTARDRLLVGIAHDRIVQLGEQYIQRGWITKDEYENLHDYLYIPYKELGGNGTARKIMEDVSRLPFKKRRGTDEAFE